jgi:hypothetical protein
MTFVSGEIVWGATIDSEPESEPGPSTWTVELESESLGSVVVDSALPRFAHHAQRLAPSENPTCSLALGRFRMTIRIDAADPHEAAETGEHVFLLALESALWPRSDFAGLAQYSVTVTAGEDYATAA